MTAWLHFIGRKYYPTETKFIREAEKYGITRRVSLQVLKKMEYDDLVLLAMMKGKSGVIFGCFNISTLSGLSREASEAVRETFEWEKMDDGGGFVRRGCGFYWQGPCYAVKASLQEIAVFLERLKQEGVNIGVPMIGGTFRPHRRIRLKDVPFRQGFRKIDYGKMMEDLKARESPDKKIIVLRGQYYVSDDGEAEGGVEGGYIAEVRNYEGRA